MKIQRITKHQLSWLGIIEPTIMAKKKNLVFHQYSIIMNISKYSNSVEE